MSSNRLRALSMLNLDAERERMTGQLALCLAENLKSLMAMDSTGRQKTIAEAQQWLPPDIKATLAEGNLHVAVIPHRSYENPMSLPSILQDSDLDTPHPPALELSEEPDTRDECLGTPTDFESYVEEMSIYPEEYIWDNFDVVDCPSWMDNDVLSRYD
ncbi:hypothetical protein UA08_09448 [Talaromyces atroroseus]|uniref:Uncharacterized protein n=1 Tax=Talaromyces atroroseus TaxID=1441469 RepID=A0A225A6M4_TALAT|nr:hypothetical protein UA08_09448 [Talaromyces atroroseus]OKL55280.1 hypothetical protein UA08_09448 [Talaromyces atroroseus]